MKSKLTLKIDNHIIEQAKVYARNKNTSLSKLIKNYLTILTSGNNFDSEGITPLVKSISGVLYNAKASDLNGAYKEHLNEKYSGQ